MLCQGPTYKTEEDWHRCYLRANLPQAKRGRLVTDVSSGESFSAKKKRKNVGNIDFSMVTLPYLLVALVRNCSSEWSKRLHSGGRPMSWALSGSPCYISLAQCVPGCTEGVNSHEYSDRRRTYSTGMLRNQNWGEIKRGERRSTNNFQKNTRNRKSEMLQSLHGLSVKFLKGKQ